MSNDERVDKGIVTVIGELRSILEEAKKRVDELTAENNTLEGKVRQMAEANFHLQNSNNQIQSELNALQHQIRGLREDVMRDTV